MDFGNLSRKTKRILTQNNLPLIHLHECKGEFYSFSNALERAVDHNEFGPYVDKHSPEELRESGARAFLSRDKMAGVAVFPDGNIRAVFRDNRSKAKFARVELMLTALSVGGNKLDCFDGMLTVIYSKFGFIPVARVKFNPEFAPENWKDSFGQPDIIFWVHNGDSVETVAERMLTYPQYSPSDISALPCYDSYDDAYSARDKLLLDM